MSSDESATVLTAVNKLLCDALEQRASDIHIENPDGEFRVRLRIDGVLQPYTCDDSCDPNALVERFKAMCCMNTDVHDLPQDGRVVMSVAGRQCDFRVSVIPTVHGERVTVRVLDRQRVRLDLSGLGLAEDHLALVSRFCSLPNGIVLVTGPVGTGKTTLLYAMLMSLDREHTSVFTIEDPVEYLLDGVSQLQIRPAKGVTFTTASRAVLRQDPDVVMIGEIRDLATVHLAVQMSLTGHLVFTSLHASTAPGAVQRLIDMGTEPFLVRQTVAGVISSRLVRTLCTECRQPAEPDPALVPPSAADFMRAHPGNYCVPQGCDACRRTGYCGRTTIQEVLAPTPHFLASVRKGVTADALTRAARDAGMRSMLEDGILKAAQGITSVAEVIRVTYGGPNC